MWQYYDKIKPQEMRPYVSGEDLTGISVSKNEIPEIGGMIARDEFGSQWYVSKEFFEKNYALSGYNDLTRRARAAEMFVTHIEDHLAPGQQVLCKICGQTFDEIFNSIL